MLAENRKPFAAVAIGRNEGDRLKDCLGSLSSAASIVYVDSGSSDGSTERAASLGAEVLRLDMLTPFTAARARNAGFRRAKQLLPDIEYVQFVDGDCKLVDTWPLQAILFLEMQKDVAVVAGRRRERNADHSVYNFLCDREWNGRIGRVSSVGGDAMVRVSAMNQVEGFREDLIAGEEPELCLRLRRCGWTVWRLDAEMTLHDAAMDRFGQWWVRSSRAGYAFAQGAHLHGALPERFNVWEARRAWLWGFWLPVVCLAAVLSFGAWGWATILVYPAQILRQIARNRGTLRERCLVAIFQVLARFPEVIGQSTFLFDRLSGRRSGLMEYK